MKHLFFISLVAFNIYASESVVSNFTGITGILEQPQKLSTVDNCVELPALQNHGHLFMFQLPIGLASLDHNEMFRRCKMDGYKGTKVLTGGIRCKFSHTVDHGLEGPEYTSTEFRLKFTCQNLKTKDLSDYARSQGYEKLSMNFVGAFHPNNHRSGEPICTFDDQVKR